MTEDNPELTKLPATKIRKGDITLSSTTVEQLKTKGYFIAKKLGSGSYGSVVLAFAESLKKNVAMKIMETEKLGPEFINRFLSREIEILKSLKRHPHIVEFYDLYRDDRYFYIVLEYCSNGDLYEYVCKHRFIPESQSCFWFKQLIDGVGHCHQQGFAHRDLKCENLLLDSNYNIKITDFGFACKLRWRKDCTQWELENMSTSSLEVLSTTFCGSVLYACPELLKSQPYNPTKSDVWSCGVVLWIMIFGSYPFDEDRIRESVENDDFSFVYPDHPVTSSEFKILISNIFIDELYRSNIAQIKQCSWCNKEWPDSPVARDANYYENLCIPRQETTEIIFDSSPKARTSTDDDLYDRSDLERSRRKPSTRRSSITMQFKLAPSKSKKSRESVKDKPQEKSSQDKRPQ